MTSPGARLWLRCALVLGAGGCFGGPISDFPKAEGEKPAYQAGDNAGTPDDVEAIDPDSDLQELPPRTPTTRPPHVEDSSADGDVGLGGIGADAGAAAPELGESCGVPTADGGCDGALCGVTRSELESMVMPGGACVTDTAELGLVCDETLARVVGECTQEAVRDGSFNGIDACAANDPSLDAASDDCVSCYVQDNQCMLANCLVDCVLSNTGDACAMCRQTHCAEAFAKCSGLPAGSQPSMVAPGAMP